MKPKEHIDTDIEFPSLPQRMDAKEKARQLLHPPDEVPAGPVLTKFTTRIFPEQMAWLRSEVQRFRQHYPRAPKLTIEELTRIALDHLRDTANVESVIMRYRR